ncbi:MAG: DJ-1/PfpI family protein [Pseudomonadota bacterium]
MNVAIFVYAGAEVLDFSGPFEVFSTASRVSADADLFNAFIVAETADPVVARAGYTVLPHYAMSDHPDIDLLLIAGGVHEPQMQRTPVIDWISAQSKTATHVASVCTGAFLLAQAKVIETQTVTTHWEDIDDLQERFPALNVVRNRRWVEDGPLTTSAGISAGIDMSLHLVRRFADASLATNTAMKMEYDWNDVA